ncbi:hypothetical protein P9850_12680 [Anoxybacillus rupiensis]|uniref:Uncharacterized protein n=1 Tax=Anoxybacteroides rupiense TaxID=311460 RepID=A0ABD5IWG7_9BACL|nr:hypothetical protein [Anoxybacillus rupiensis]
MLENFMISDRHPIRDPQDAKVVGYCAGCGQEIYDGDEIIEINGEMIHENKDCAFDFCAEVGFARVAGE